LPVNQWLHEKDWRYTKNELLRASSGEEYLTGFHVYHKVWQAQSQAYLSDRVVRAVNVAEPVATGYQGLKACTVAQLMEILPGWKHSGKNV